MPGRRLGVNTDHLSQIALRAQFIGTVQGHLGEGISVDRHGPDMWLGESI